MNGKKKNQEEIKTIYIKQNKEQEDDNIRKTEEETGRVQQDNG